MRRRHTRRSDPALKGTSIQRAIRLPEVQLVAVQEAIAGGIPDIHSVTDAVTDALWLWLYENGHVNGHDPVGGGSAVSSGSAEPPPPAPEPTEADQPYQGSAERPRWADVDVTVLDD